MHSSPMQTLGKAPRHRRLRRCVGSQRRAHGRPADARRRLRGNGRGRCRRAGQGPGSKSHRRSCRSAPAAPSRNHSTAFGGREHGVHDPRPRDLRRGQLKDLTPWQQIRHVVNDRLSSLGARQAPALPPLRRRAGPCGGDHRGDRTCHGRGGALCTGHLLRRGRPDARWHRPHGALAAPALRDRLPTAQARHQRMRLPPYSTLPAFQTAIDATGTLGINRGRPAVGRG